MIPLSLAPMMDRTDRHFRYFLRRLAPSTLLYTEMLHSSAVIHGDRERLLGFDPSEHPVALQLGGDDPAELAEAARVAADRGYDEINLNVGCPSERVQHRRFGACLMTWPDVVARCVEAMRRAVDVEVTVKHRIGVDDLDSYEHMLRFVDIVAEAGCRRFTVHARKAWLKGLSPKENREVPPLRYDDVYRLKAERPRLQVELNGGVRSVGEIQRHLERVDGVMIGRAAIDDPYLFARAEAALFGTPLPDRGDVVRELATYADALATDGVPAHRLTRHLHGLFAGQPGARAWRRGLSESAGELGGGVLLDALAAMGRVNPREVA